MAGSVSDPCSLANTLDEQMWTDVIFGKENTGIERVSVDPFLFRSVEEQHFLTQVVLVALF